MSVSSAHRRQAGTQIFRATLLLLIALIVVLEWPGLHWRQSAPTIGLTTQDLVIREVPDSGLNPDIDLLPGDIITHVADTRVRNHYHFESLLADRRGGPVALDVIRGTESHSTIAQVASESRRTTADVFSVIVAASFLVVGLWVFVRRHDVLGSLFVTMCVLVTYLLTHRPPPSAAGLQLALELLDDTVTLLFPAVLVHFFMVFPDRSTVRRFRGSATDIAAVYGLPLTLLAIIAIVSTARFVGTDIPYQYVQPLIAVAALYFVVYIIVSVVLFFRSYRTSNSAQRQKLRVVIAGTTLGIVPFGIEVMLRTARPESEVGFSSATVLLLGSVPLSFGYAIVKHGAIEFGGIIRRSLVYAILTGLILGVYYVLVDVIGRYLLAGTTVNRAVALPVAVILLAILFAPAREALQRFVDRVFFRREYVFADELSDYQERLAGSVDREQVWGLLLSKLNEVFQPSYLALYEANGREDFALREQQGAPPRLPGSLGNNLFVARYLSRYRIPLLAEFLDRAWQRPNMDHNSRRLLRLDGLSVCLPIATAGEMVGIVLLGEKQSGLAYGEADARLLRAFGEHTALLSHNADLVRASVERERLKSEVMLAQEIQQSLYPNPLPADTPVQLAALSQPCHEVGGDYFDYFVIKGHYLAVAIGDVSGKGIPAAMLAASVQGALRNAARPGHMGPADVNAALNRYLCENSNEQRFMSFFYALMDLESGRLDYSNAGHCPPLLLRSGYVDRLTRGGMMLGISPGGDYEEGTVQLDPGDRLLLYTDGLEEQANPAGEQFGEARLAMALRSRTSLPIAEFQASIHDEVIAFAGRNCDDDLTSLIVEMPVP